MCVGIPMQIVAIKPGYALAKGRGREEAIDMALIGEQPVGSWLLCFLGSARNVIDADEAAKIDQALDALEAVNAGKDIGSAFDDIVKRDPQLPPHLEEARRNGKAVG